MNEEILREQIVKLALLELNKEYIHGSHGPDTFDCAGLVWYIYNKLFDINLYNKGYGISTTTRIMTSEYGILTLYPEKDENKDLSNLKKGDVLFFHRQSLKEEGPKVNNKYPGHCGIYLENNDFIHCSRKEGKVVVDNFVEKEYYKNIFVGNKDIVCDDKILIKTK